MLHDLPVANVQLQPCFVGAYELTPVPGGHHCASCQRVVHDFTQATAAEVAAARAASPDGRVCGRFRGAQLSRLHLRPKLRQFLLAAVLVLMHGLTARQAWAQVWQGVPFARTSIQQDISRMPSIRNASFVRYATNRAAAVHEELPFVGLVVEPMPEFRGGHVGLLKFFHDNVRYPATSAEGKVFISFRVTETGQVRNARVVRSAHPLLDAEALRVVRLMPAWQPGRQQNRPVEVSYTFPVTFVHAKN